MTDSLRVCSFSGCGPPRLFPPTLTHGGSFPTCSVHCVILLVGHLRARSEVSWLQTCLCFAGPLGALLLGTILDDPTVSVTWLLVLNPWECRAVFRHSQGGFFLHLIFFCTTQSQYREAFLLPSMGQISFLLFTHWICPFSGGSQLFLGS